MVKIKLKNLPSIKTYFYFILFFIFYLTKQMYSPRIKLNVDTFTCIRWIRHGKRMNNMYFLIKCDRIDIKE